LDYAAVFLHNIADFVFEHVKRIDMYRRSKGDNRFKSPHCPEPKSLLLVAVIVVSVTIYFASANSVTYYDRWQQQIQVTKGLNASIQVLNADNDYLRSKIDDLERRLSEEEEKYDLLIVANSRLALYRPSRDELVSFLRADDTNEQPYYEKKFVCLHRAEQLFFRAKEKRINMSFIAYNIKTPLTSFGHVVNGVFLEDGTYLVINPVQDQLFDGSSVKWEKTGDSKTDRLYPPLLEFMSQETGFKPEQLAFKQTPIEVWP